MSIFSTITRMAVLLSSVFCAFMAVAQTSLQERLKRVLETRDMEIGLQLYNEISEDEIEQLSDSSMFNYHYLGAYINSELLPDKERNFEKALNHFLAAKRLCETSIGVHSGDYMEIMRGLGDTYLELGQPEEAAFIYQEGIVKSMYMRTSASHDFGNLIVGLQDCYEQLGWFGEIPSHLQDAWIFWRKDFDPFDTYNYWPLWSLRQFYRRYGMLDEALAISSHIIKFIEEQVGALHPEMAEAMFIKGNILRDMNNVNGCILTYSKGLEVIEKNGMTNSELYGLIESNLFMALLSAERFEESDDVLDRIKNYSISNNTSTYKNALFYAANRLADMRKYAKSLTYNSTLLDSDITDEERTAIENQRSSILYNQEIVESLPALERTFASLRIGQDDWFETGHKLSSAYYFVKNYEKNRSVLTEMYQAIDLNKSIGTDYYLWVLNNLYGLSLDTEEFQVALRFATEKREYLSRLSDVADIYRYNALNDLVVAKMRSNTLEGIDADLEKIENFYRVRYGEMSSEYATYLHNRGRAYQLQNKLDEAKETLLRSITLQNKLEGKPLDRTVKFYMEVEQQMGEL